MLTETRLSVQSTTDVLQVAGLTFRPFRGDADYPVMASIITGSREVDGTERVLSADDIRRDYSHLINSDPSTDVEFVEVDGQPVGYSRVWWQQVDNGPRAYGHFASLLPEWRGLGIRTAMVLRNEARIREIAATHQDVTERCYESWVSGGEGHMAALLESLGYAGARFGYDMVRPSLDNIPDLAIPEGLELRPALPEHYQQIWAAAREAFRDHWGFSEDEWDYTNFAGWQEYETFRPELWQVAWEGDEVAGMILNFIDEAENREYKRKRGYTETICVRRPWRRRGLARALIASSLRVHKAQGMTEAALGVDSQNPNGALQLYQSMGYEVVKRSTLYRKPFVIEAEQGERHK